MGTVALNGICQVDEKQGESEVNPVFVNPTGALQALFVSGKTVGPAICMTPPLGKRVRVSYLSYQPTDSVECYFAFGDDPDRILWNKPFAGGIVAKDFGDSRYIQGDIDESLEFITTGEAIWNVLYSFAD